MSTPYTSLLAELETTVQRARVHAIQQVNRSLILMYWELGWQIVESQEGNGWGKSIVEQISTELIQAFPHVSGLSARNLWDMRRLYLTYKDFPKLRQAVAEIPWRHSLLLLGKEFDMEARQFYLEKSAEYGWTRAVLSHHVSAKLYERTKQEPRANNFKETLPENLIDRTNLHHDALEPKGALRWISLNSMGEEVVFRRKKAKNHLYSTAG